MVLKSSMRLLAIIPMLALLVGGCASPSKTQLREQIAALARENAFLKHQLAAQSRGITVDGPVQNSFVPWVAGLTLTQAIATANYLDPKQPSQITITRNGQTAKLDASVLLNGTKIPLKPGDIVKIQP